MTPPFRLTARGSGGDGHRFGVEIPAASPLFTGHFPGHPILPGIAHLALAQGALSEVLGRQVSLAAVRSLKLRRPVVPGDLPELRLGPPGEDGVARFEVRCGGAAASQGAIEIWNGPAPEEDGSAGEPGFPAAGFPPPESLLPHGPPAFLLHAISEVAEDGIVAVAEVPPSHPLVADGRFPAFLALEAAAQGAAALEALGRRGAPGPRIGYLVGIRDARFAVPSLPAGRRLRVTARLTGGAFPLSMYAVSLGEAGHEVAAGTLSTFLLADS
jgi:predicted hotdog family 3-hydroxylacyl-ACP dehydratase